MLSGYYLGRYYARVEASRQIDASSLRDSNQEYHKICIIRLGISHTSVDERDRMKHRDWIINE